MIAYLDTSALVKRHLAEAGSTEVNGLISEAEALGTAVISRAEVSAALAKAVRVKSVTKDAAWLDRCVWRSPARSTMWPSAAMNGTHLCAGQRLLETLEKRQGFVGSSAQSLRLSLRRFIRR